MRKLYCTILLSIMLFANALYAQGEKLTHIDSLCIAVTSGNIPDTLKAKFCTEICSKWIGKDQKLDSIDKYSNIGLRCAWENKMYTEYIDILLAKAVCTIRLGDDKGFEYMYDALDLSDSLKDEKLRTKTLRRLATSYSNNGDFALGFKYNTLCLESAQKANNLKTMAFTYRTMGILNYNVNLYENAIRYYTLAKDIFKDINDTLFVSTCNRDIAQAQYKKADNFENKYVAIQFELSFIEMMNDNDFTYQDACLSILEETWRLMREYNRKEYQDTLQNIIDDLYKRATESGAYNQQLSKEFINANIIYNLSKKNYKKAKEYVDNILEELETDHSIGIYDLYLTVIDYYKLTENWERAYYYTEKNNYFKAKFANLESSVKTERTLANKKYEERIHQREIEARDKQIAYEIQNTIQKGLNIFMLVTVVIIITIIAVRVSDLRETKKQEKVLVSSSKRLEVYNERLKSIQKLVITQNEEIISQNILLQVNRDDLIRQHKKFISSLDYAHRIQQALVQSEKIVQKVFNQSFVLWLPLDVVSGDFYWIYEDKYKKYVVTADCTGHGVPGALVSMLGISMLNDISVKFSQLTTMDIMNMYRDAFRNSLQDNLVYDGMDLALYSIDKQTNVLQFTGAHRPLFLIRNHELTELKPDRMGINNTFITDKFQFTNQEIQLQEGDMIYTFSDGITDQLGGEGGRNKFSMNQLRGLLKEISGLELSIQKSTINATITHWMSSFKTTSQTKQLDDILLIGVKI